MIKLTLITFVMLTFATVSLQAAPAKKLRVSMDNQLVTFTSPPLLKDGTWLVPLDSFCKQLGLKVEYPAGEKIAVICGNGKSELCVPLQFGENVLKIEGIAYTEPVHVAEPFGFEIYHASVNRIAVIRPEQLAPEFTLPALDDTPKHLRDFRGKKTLLYIWGSW